ncbi:ribosome silencing factor [Cerasibacillus terrae]|uniref:Ribosomal silencing factor RsfS n=1 Tax=Cerasibacillus terrae TaxID=2498845 RepID=A0A5C8P330_9BACI|nr:ribosome silencing factor [Cerasibacillus terrae]TXL68035.1 ribosome silencing factor [Cerasibacillus terrae]
METKEILNLVTEACDDKRAENIVALNMEGISLIADYFVICEGSNERQVQAIAKGIQSTLEEHDLEVNRIEGMDHARWVLVDLGDIVCHVFHKDERDYYNLERLWGDAPYVSLQIGSEE